MGDIMMRLPTRLIYITVDYIYGIAEQCRKTFLKGKQNYSVCKGETAAHTKLVIVYSCGSQTDQTEETKVHRYSKLSSTSPT